MGNTQVIIKSKDNTIDHILVAALLAAVRVNVQSYQYSELLKTNFAPTHNLANKVLLMLADSSRIEIINAASAESCLVKFCFPNDNNYLKQIIKNLKSEVIPRTGVLEGLVQNLIASESQQFIGHLVSRYGVTNDINFQPDSLLIEMLCCRPMREVHMLLWRSMKKTMEQDARLLIADNCSKQIFEMIIKGAYRLHENHNKDGSPLISFDRPTKFKRSALASVIFEYVLGCGDEYYENNEIFVNAGSWVKQHCTHTVDIN
jgi:hypothetical protein